MRLYPVFVLSVTLAACAAPAAVVVEPPPPPVEAPGPRFEAMLLKDGVLTAGSTPVSGVAAGALGDVFPGGAEGAVLFSIVAADSTRLYQTDGGRAVQVHAAAGVAHYTAVWGPDGDRAAFGHYRSAGNASPGRVSMGAGDVLLMGETVSRVGCSASRAVLAWASTGDLLVRNTDNLYLVKQADCATVATIDARRMHGLTVSPDARHLAYVHRELEYNRTTRAYEPDSTFRITDLDGGNPRTIVSFRYDPERLAWRPDGSELAFDVKASPDAGRAISIFDVESGTTAFLHPPAAGADEFGAVWSPDGERVAYRRGSEHGAFALYVRTFAEGFATAIPDSEQAELNGWVDRSTVVFTRQSGAVVVHDLATGTSVDLGTADGVVAIRRLR